MMATHRMSPSEEDDDATLSARLPIGEDGGVDHADSMGSLFLAEEEPFSWPGPKTLCLRRTAQGFGFTLRHFIVYPPESAVHSSLKDEDHSHRGRQRGRLEPMDTIFVKQVKEGGPAHGAGLCTGDRLVKVNGESIIGKTYSQVIALIQNSEAFLELCVMPKDEDILQLAYSQDAYLKGHDPYSGNACHIPQPPPVCYPRIDCKPPSGMAQATESPSSGGHPSELGYRVEIPMPPSPPLPLALPKAQTAVCVCSDTGVRTVVVPPDGHMVHPGPAHRGDYAMMAPEPVMIRPRPSAVPGGGRPAYPHPRKADIYPGYHGEPYGMQPVQFHPGASASPGSHQNIDWRSYQTYREYIDNKGLHAYGRTIQERLDSLRTAPQGVHRGMPCGPPPPPSAWDPRLRRRSTSHERSYAGPAMRPPPRSASQDRMIGSERARHHPDWPPRSTSQDGLVRKARARSTDYVEHMDLMQPGGAAWPVDRRMYAPQRAEPQPPHPQQRLSRQSQPPRSAMLQRSPAGYPGPNSSVRGRAQIGSRTDIPPPSVPAERPPCLGLALTPEPTPKDQRAAGNHLSHMPHHLQQQQQQQQRSRAETLQAMEAGRERDMVVGARSSSCSSAPPPQRSPAVLRPHLQEQQLSPAANGRGTSTDNVVMREKPPAGKNGPQPLRHPSYILAVNDDPPGAGAAGATGSPASCWLPNDARREVHMRRIGESLNESFSSTLDESLDSIPFIDEPASPSVDRDATHIPASVVIAGPSTATAATPSPTTPSPLIHRQLSHDQESLKNAILESQNGTKTERSKSYDEGLDNYREEGRGRSSSKHMPSLKVFRRAVDGHKSSEDSGSRRDSSSDVFVDSSKEGLMNFRQLNTDKNKRVGGGIRAWKQMYSVLRGHSLYLYRDKKECIAHAQSQLEEVPQPISIKACLIDISYSETKRKNVLRLTTSDCEYLFQAENRDDMLSWIRVIQDNSNLDEENAPVTSTDLINRKINMYTMMSAPSKSKSQSPHSPKHEDRKNYNDSSPPRDRWRIPGRKKPTEKKQTAGVTFGVRLDNCPPAQNNRCVPLIVEVCCKLVEERGLEYTGIYRVPGNNAAISNMQEELDTKGMNDIDIEEDKWRDLNVISSLLKSFFRKLPEPLFTNEKYGDFIDANRIPDPVERLKVLKRLIHELPDHHYETLKYLSGHLKLVSENCEKNKMEPRNLAIVFGPTLVRTAEDNMTNMVTHMPDQYKIVETLIQQYDWFFVDDGEEEPIGVTEQDSTVQSQPVPNIDHLLPNIGRTATTPGEVSDSASDSARSKGSWGSGKDQYSRELLRSSIFASRKRKKPKDKSQPSSSDDDLDALFPKKEPQEQSGGGQPAWSQQPEEEGGPGDDDEGDEEEDENRAQGHLHQEEEVRRENGKCGVSVGVTEEQCPSHLEQTPGGTLLPNGGGDDGGVDDLTHQPEAELCPSPKPGSSPSLSYRMQAVRQCSLSDPPSSVYDEGCTSDLGTLNSTSSQASAGRPPRQRSRIPCGWTAEGAAAAAEVCSITSDYSTTSSMTFTTVGGDSASTIMSPELRPGAESRGTVATHDDDADDERSELVSEGRPMETDSESDLSVFAVCRDIGPSLEDSGCKDRGVCTTVPISSAPEMANACGSSLAASQRLIAGDTLARKKSSRQKTDSESSVESSGRSERDPGRLARVLGVVKGRSSTGSLSSSSQRCSGGEQPACGGDGTGSGGERGAGGNGIAGAGAGASADSQAWRLKITDRLKFRLRSSADDMFGVGRSPETRAKRKGNIRRRHTMGGQRDFAELTVLGEPSELSAVDRLKPKCSSQDFSIRDWIVRERHRVSNPEVSLLGAASSSSSSQTLQGLPHDCPVQGDGGLANGDGLSAQGKSLSLGADAHPHKLSGSQVVRSRFYQYL
ncbi:rho GTPase-activating protein 21 isoform X2 [Engraulis encrasicolus]|uniref:rho GTPase-activating protein 21 isoform X2 n=1 Tax=Engraulis encrasicolus TaxID=184585 RepID=UPI002FD42DC4